VSETTCEDSTKGMEKPTLLGELRAKSLG